jgi:hypothetical protein
MRTQLPMQQQRRGWERSLTLGAFGVIAAMALLLAAEAAQATIYLNLDAEEGTVAETVPFPPFCQACGGGGPWPRDLQSGGGWGSKYYRWQTQDNQLETYTEVLLPGYRPFAHITNILGNTYYLAAYVRYDRIGGRDIWHDGECGGCDSFDKLIYLWGPSVVRWGIIFGQRSSSHAANQDHKYSTYVIDCSACDLTPDVKVGDTYPQNQSGFSMTNPIQLDYERWYSIVFAVRMATDQTGWFTLYVDGTKVSEWTDRQTVAVGVTPSIEQLILGGTIAQPAYDSPAHQVKVDALLLTDNWQDIVNGGYLSGGDTLAPAAPMNLTVQ